jgi:hypothetical protein
MPSHIFVSSRCVRWVKTAFHGEVRKLHLILGDVLRLGDPAAQCIAGRTQDLVAVVAQAVAVLTVAIDLDTATLAVPDELEHKSVHWMGNYL